MVGSIVLIATVAALVSVAIWKFNQDPSPTALLWPPEGPRAHIALLVDKTDPLTFTQAKAFAGLLSSFSSGRRVKEGELLSVFVLGEDFRKTADPIFEKCNPGDGRDKSKVKDNPDLWKKRFREEYEVPVLQLEDQLKSLKPAARSPIMEMIQLVSVAFERRDVRGPRRLIIVSDLLHNTSDLSMYSESVDFETAMKRAEFQRLRAKLPGTDVDVFLLLNRPEVQNRSLIKFWEDYFKDAGAVLQHVEPVPG